MANRLTSNPIYIDQCNSADYTLAKKGVPFVVKKIRIVSAADGDIFRLEDEDGAYTLHMVQSGNADAVECDFGDAGFDFGTKGCYIDISDCTGMAGTDGTDAIWIYLV